MEETMKKHLSLTTAFFCLLLAGFSAFPAAGASQAIDAVSLSVEDAGSLAAGEPVEEVTVTTQDSEYYVDSAYFLNDHEIWQRNERPKVRVELYAEESFRFAHTGKRYFSLDGYGAEFISASIMDGGSYMEVDLYLERVTGDGDSSRTDYGLYWEGNTATWDDAYGTDNWEVRLYRWSSSNSGSSVVTTKKTGGNEYDFTDYMTVKGYYSFRVRPYDSGYDASQMWSDHSDRLYVDSEEAADNRDDGFGSSDRGYSDSHSGPGYDGSQPYGSGYGNDGYGNDGYGGGGYYGSYGGPGYEGSGYEGNPVANSAGRWASDANGWWYRYDNGGWPFHSWQMIQGKWYYFNQQGYVQTGWFILDGAWYYSFPDGSRAAGWQKIGPYWYYLSNTGQMLTGWTLVGNGWYYLDPESGAMWAGRFTPDGHYVNADGVRLY